MKQSLFTLAIVSLIALSCSKKEIIPSNIGNIDSIKVDSTVVDSVNLDSKVLIDSLKAEQEL